MRQLRVPPEIQRHASSKELLFEELSHIKDALMRHSSALPFISIIIPAYNEEENLLKTLSSLSASSTSRTFEVIVVDNNSTDSSAAFAHLAGVTCVQEKMQGITPARNRGLAESVGKYILNADADTIYPPAWIDLMIDPLEKESASLTYASHSFLPEKFMQRNAYLFYEYGADIVKWLNRTYREEAVNVYGFNSAFIREEGLAVNGFEHPPGTNEDGWLAVKLRKFTGRPLFFQSDAAARVWTSDRRLRADGGLFPAMLKRILK